jgi:hypothetical protein
MNRCRVSFTDSNGIPHDVEVQAESLYEAVALAVAEFRADKMTAEVGPMTEFVIAIHRVPQWNITSRSVRSHSGPKARATVRQAS